MSDRYLYHYTTAAGWDTSQTDGEHRISGRGMTLESEGFIHFCYADQRPGVWQRFWAAETAPVVLLTVDPDEVGEALVDENTSGGTELFPHLYGPLPLDAVIAVHDVDEAGEPIG